MGEALYDTNRLIQVYKRGEKVKGYTIILNVVEYPKALLLKGLTVIYPLRKNYDKSVRIAKVLLLKRSPVPAIDILIAAIALNRNLKVETSNKHFKKIMPHVAGPDPVNV